MIYHNYQDMADALRRGLWMVPHDVDIIVGIPRSGMIPALMLAELLNKRCADLDAFIDGREMSFGRRGGLMRGGNIGKVLIVDDSVASGNALNAVKRRLEAMKERYTFVYACVYAESREATGLVDICFDNIWRDGEKFYRKEWNILHLFPHLANAGMWDIDSLLCKEPPNDKDTEAYEAYLRDAVPMIIPTTPIGAIVTYRLEKYRDVTEAWLQRNGIRYKRLVMFNAPDRVTRNRTISGGGFKGKVYAAATWARLFYESDAHQAEVISKMSGKPVFCYENGRVYGTEVESEE